MPSQPRGIVLEKEKVRDGRRKRAWTQRVLAKKAGVALDVVVNAEGGRSVSSNSARYLAEALELEVENIVAPQVVDSNILAEGQGVVRRLVELTREHLQDSIRQRFSQDLGEQYVKQGLTKDEAMARAEFLFHQIISYQIRQLSDGNFEFNLEPIFTDRSDVLNIACLTILGSEMAAMRVRYQNIQDEDLGLLARLVRVQLEALVEVVSEKLDDGAYVTFKTYALITRGEVDEVIGDEAPAYPSELHKSLRYYGIPVAILIRNCFDSRGADFDVMGMENADAIEADFDAAQREGYARIQFLATQLWKLGRDPRYTFLFEDAVRLFEFAYVTVIGSERAGMKKPKKGASMSMIEAIAGEAEMALADQMKRRTDPAP